MAKSAAVINILASGSFAGVSVNLIDEVTTNGKGETKKVSYVEFPSIKDGKDVLTVRTSKVLEALTLINQAPDNKAKKNAINASPMALAIQAAEEEEGESVTDTFVRAADELSTFIYEYGEEEEGRDTTTTTVNLLAKMLLANTPAHQPIPATLTISEDFFQKAYEKAKKLEEKNGRNDKGFVKLSVRQTASAPVRVDMTSK
jgi:hypothetical protein